MNIKNILIFGGSGSLGNKFISRNIHDNNIYNFSRDECKHWKLEQKYKKIKNIIGDIRDKYKVKKSLVEVKPQIIIIAAAMKHIDRCEYETSECIKTNIIGIQNIVDSIIELEYIIHIENVVFISTDKACSPINIYGMCKGISEKIISEAALKTKSIKYNIVRYGNVLNSRGSIIPYLHSLGKDNSIEYLTLTDPRMTRFIMSLDDSCELIEYAIKNGKNGETIIPEIKSMRLVDMFEIFSEIYNKKIKITGLRPGEKLYESLINGTQYQLQYKENNYYHITSNFNGKLLNEYEIDLNSNINIISKDKLEDYLNSLDLLNKNYKDD